MYRSVLLNNGHRVRTPSQTTPQEVVSVSVHQTGNGTQFETESQISSESQPFSVDPSMGEGEMNIGSSNNRDIPIDARGDIIQFYNKVFIDFVKDYVLKFSPGDDVSSYNNRHEVFTCTLLWYRGKLLNYHLYL